MPALIAEAKHMEKCANMEYAAHNSNCSSNGNGGENSNGNKRQNTNHSNSNSNCNNGNCSQSANFSCPKKEDTTKVTVVIHMCAVLQARVDLASDKDNMLKNGNVWLASDVIN
ncbi:hypothetical protein DSO57_1036785 [Entomophthora muscae]|uniref:Uncharacterized protein n=1 Tax=Entomophthora muscae TaxID=34485 RepID=A0ACC2RDY6_9FUNG|nr:hypothetical protein DSO57_1036785 [Entomophthora muscae]